MGLHLRRIMALLVLLAIPVSGTDSLTTDQTLEACDANWKKTGGFREGMVFSSWVEYPEVGRDEAIERVVRHLALQGFPRIVTDKEVGLITVTGSGVLNVVVTKQESGAVKIEATFRGPTYQRLPEKVFKRDLCAMLGAPGRE